MTGYKVNIQKLKAFLYTNNEISEREIRGKKPYLLQKQEKVKVPKNKYNPGGKTHAVGILQNTEEIN